MHSKFINLENPTETLSLHELNKIVSEVWNVELRENSLLCIDSSVPDWYTIISMSCYINRLSNLEFIKKSLERVFSCLFNIDVNNENFKKHIINPHTKLIDYFISRGISIVEN